MAVRLHLPRRRLHAPSILAISALLGLVCAIASISSVSLLPPKLHSRHLEIGGATTEVLVDMPQSMVQRTRPTWNFQVGTLITRADLLANLMASGPALQYIGHAAGVPPDQIAATAPITIGVPSDLTAPGSEQRAWQLAVQGDPYRLELQARTDSPIIDVYAQAPSPAAAAQLADAATTGLRSYLRATGMSEGFNPTDQLRLVQLGQPHTGVLNSGAKYKIAGLTFLFAFALAAALLFGVARLLGPGPRTEGRRSGGATRARTAALHTARTISRTGERVRDWPRTTRVMPWMLAAFLAVLWLVPFDSISLKVHLPIDMKFDRLVLPFIVLMWVLTFAVGGRTAPRIRLTKIHVAVGVFVGLAFLSVVVNANSLNQTLELDTSVKQLPLLISYLSLFVMVASVIRRSELRPFLTYTLTLALICAVGMIIEYKTRYNVFFNLSSRLLPGSLFSVAANTEGYDSSGRLSTHGPTAHGLAAASILAMALPIALVRLMDSRSWRPRLLYGLVCGVLVVAILATQKKTALIAPAAALVILVWFRRREMLRLAPAALVALIVVLIISPGTVDPVLNQFSPEAFGSTAPATTSDRAARYDAIRPDVFTHLLVGRGYGSYQPLGHRILDSELLLRLIEMGVLGLVAFFALGLSVIATARKAINSRDAVRAPPALSGAAAAAVFVVVAELFDSMSFPQVPYIFLFLAALVAVAVKPPEESDVSQVAHGTAIGRNRRSLGTRPGRGAPFHVASRPSH